VVVEEVLVLQVEMDHQEQLVELVELEHQQRLVAYQQHMLVVEEEEHLLVQPMHQEVLVVEDKDSLEMVQVALAQITLVAAVVALDIKVLHQILVPRTVVMAALESLSFAGHKINTKRLHSCQ